MEVAWESDTSKNHYRNVSSELVFFIFEKNRRNWRNGVTNWLETTAHGACSGYGQVTLVTGARIKGLNIDIPFIRFKSVLFFFLF